jgi:hypothetical protein
MNYRKAGVLLCSIAVAHMSQYRTVSTRLHSFWEIRKHIIALRTSQHPRFRYNCI